MTASAAGGSAGASAGAPAASGSGPGAAGAASSLTDGSALGAMSAAASAALRFFSASATAARACRTPLPDAMAVFRVARASSRAWVAMATGSAWADAGSAAWARTIGAGGATGAVASAGQAMERAAPARSSDFMLMIFFLKREPSGRDRPSVPSTGGKSAAGSRRQTAKARPFCGRLLPWEQVNGSGGKSFQPFTGCRDEQHHIAVVRTECRSTPAQGPVAIGVSFRPPHSVHEPS